VSRNVVPQIVRFGHERGASDPVVDDRQSDPEVANRDHHCESVGCRSENSAI
jgi:hypothetical protein